jgi:hypothetical protein
MSRHRAIISEIMIDQALPPIDVHFSIFRLFKNWRRRCCSRSLSDFLLFSPECGSFHAFGRWTIPYGHFRLWFVILIAE